MSKIVMSEEDGKMEMSEASKIADALKSKTEVEFTFRNDCIMSIHGSAGTFAVLGDVYYIQLTYGVPIPDVYWDGYDAYQTEYFRADDFDLAAKAYIIRCNSPSPEKATGLGSTLEQIAHHLKGNDPLLKARSYLLVAWSSEKQKGSATARTVALAALINDLDTLYAIPDAKAEDETWKAEVKTMIDNNQEIAAIKLYRSKSGVGLREAQFAVLKMKS